MSDDKQPSGANSDVPAKVEIEPFEGFSGDNFISRITFPKFLGSKCSSHLVSIYEFKDHFHFHPCSNAVRALYRRARVA